MDEFYWEHTEVSRKLAERTASFLGVLTVLLLGVVIYLQATINRTPPISAFTATEVINEDCCVVPGGTLFVRIYREKLRDDCSVTSLRSAVALDNGNSGRAYQLPPSIDMAGGPPDQSYFDQGYPMPAWLSPGEYLLRVHLIYDCHGMVFHYDQPDTAFTVAEAP
jgi:hypothetical protein